MPRAVLVGLCLTAEPDDLADDGRRNSATFGWNRPIDLQGSVQRARKRQILGNGNIMLLGHLAYAKFKGIDALEDSAAILPDSYLSATVK